MIKYTSALSNSHDKYIVPSDKIIDENLELVDYDGYIPVNFVKDLINVASYSVIADNPEGAIKVPGEYASSIIKLFCKLNTSIHHKINSPVYIAASIIKKLHDSNMDFRTLEMFREEGLTVQESYGNTFNYKYDITEISYALSKFLEITEDQIGQIERLPPDIIKILNFVNSIGDSLFPASITTKTEYSSIKSYGHIAKSNLTKLGRPDFISKFATKNLDAKYCVDKVITGKKLVVGISTNAKLGNYIDMLYKLIGTLILTHKQNGIKNEVILYVDFGNEYKKFNLSESVDLLKSTFQLSIFNKRNSDFLSAIAFKEPNSTLLFVPIFDEPCALSSTSLNGCKINMLVPSQSILLKRYRYMCSKTGGQVITI